jgi:predicted dehydrogenase
MPIQQAKPLRVGLAGLGRFGALHASALSRLPEVELCAIADSDPVRLQAMGERLGVARRCDNAQALIEASDLEALVFVTPDEQHLEQGLAALSTGKGVFLEKPMAPSWREATRLQHMAEAHGALLQVGLILRYDLPHALLQRQIAAGDFGELISIRTRRNCAATSFAAIANRVHTVFRTLIHDIDLLLWLTGSHATTVMALERRLGDQLSPEGCFALIQLANGQVGQLETSWFLPAQAPANVVSDHGVGSIDAELAVVGSRQSARLRWLDGPLQVWGPERQLCPDTSLWPQLDGRVHGALMEQLRDFAMAVRNGQPSTFASLEQAFEGLRIAEAIIEASRRGSVVRMDDGKNLDRTGPVATPNS